MTTPAQLRKRYPYMFNGQHLGIDISVGWFPLFSQLCTDIDILLADDKLGFCWTQVKEKFGAARFYYQIHGTKSVLRANIIDENGHVHLLMTTAPENPATIQERIGALIQDAETKTLTSCICCGEPGESDRGDGYFLVLCPKHTKIRKGGGNHQLKIWFEDKDELPIVFLDFDGVLHPEPSWPENTFCRKDLLEEVLREFPHVPIVISSTWRETHSMGDMKAMFSPDIAVRIIGKTPFLRNPRKNDILNCDGEPPPWERQWEIERWMGKNRAMGSPWVAIDDRPRWFKDGCPNLLATSSNVGFSKSDQETLRQMIEKRLP